MAEFVQITHVHVGRSKSRSTLGRSRVGVPGSGGEGWRGGEKWFGLQNPSSDSAMFCPSRIPYFA